MLRDDARTTAMTEAEQQIREALEQVDREELEVAREKLDSAFIDAVLHAQVAIRVARYLQGCSPKNIAAMLDEIGRLRSWELAGREWFDKTEWIQQDCRPHWLGRHRADILRSEIERLSAENEALRADAARPAIDLVCLLNAARRAVIALAAAAERAPEFAHDYELLSKSLERFQGN